MARSRLVAYAFVGPAILLLTALLLWPLAAAAAMSLQVRQGDTVQLGLDHFWWVLEQPTTWNSFAKTIAYTVGSVSLHLAVGLGLALLLNQHLRGRTIFRTILLLPWMVIPVVAALTSRWMLDPTYGIVNELLVQVGIIEASVAWLSDLATVMPVTIATNVWHGYPFVFIVFLAGLQSIPREQYEAAAMDGAGKLAAFRYVTLPHLRFIALVVSTLDTVWTFKQFVIVHVLTQGGPARETEVLAILVYRTAFELFKVEQAAALAMIVFGLNLVLSLIYLRFLRFSSA